VALRGIISFNILEWSAYMLEAEAYMLDGGTQYSGVLDAIFLLLLFRKQTSEFTLQSCRF